jgi:hypothetical protein
LFSTSSLTLSHGLNGRIFPASLLWETSFSTSGTGDEDDLELTGLACAASVFRGVIGDVNIGDVDGGTRCGIVRFIAVSYSVNKKSMLFKRNKNYLFLNIFFHNLF